MFFESARSSRACARSMVAIHLGPVRSVFTIVSDAPGVTPHLRKVYAVFLHGLAVRRVDIFDKEVRCGGEMKARGRTS